MSRIYFVAGEASGDNHGAELLRALRERDPQVEFFGRGGPKMRAVAGHRFRDWMQEAAVVGLWEVLKRYGFFRREFRAGVREIEALRPDAVVLIDYPGFNLRLARALRRTNATLKIIYYISPQVWAWNHRRVNSMARSIDLILCIFPFEPQFYARAAMRAVFVGHPMAQSPASANDATRDRQLVALFPGSREREVKKILPIMLRAAHELLRNHRQLRFEIAAASESLREKIAAESDEQFSVTVGNAPALLARAGAGMIASGTATLEAAVAGLPFVLVYRVSWLTYFAARLVVKVRWLGMPNVLANREIVPEFIQHGARPRAIAPAVARLLDDEAARGTMLKGFAEVRRELSGGAVETNAAEVILNELRSSSGAPHSEPATASQQ